RIADPARRAGDHHDRYLEPHARSLGAIQNGPRIVDILKALSFQGVGDVKLVEVPKPSIKDSRDVLVKITLGAVCGSDLHAYHGHIPMNAGELLGHEFAGVVEEPGSEVRRCTPGHRVAASGHAS